VSKGFSQFENDWNETFFFCLLVSNWWTNYLCIGCNVVMDFEIHQDDVNMSFLGKIFEKRFMHNKFKPLMFK
jgi:hypothetical protein